MARKLNAKSLFKFQIAAILKLSNFTIYKKDFFSFDYNKGSLFI